jgi:hypothetical protein
MYNLTEAEWFKTILLQAVLGFPIKLKAAEITEGSLLQLK